MNPTIPSGKKDEPKKPDPTKLDEEYEYGYEGGEEPPPEDGEKKPEDGEITPGRKASNDAHEAHRASFGVPKTSPKEKEPEAKAEAGAKEKK